MLYQFAQVYKKCSKRYQEHYFEDPDSFRTWHLTPRVNFYLDWYRRMWYLLIFGGTNIKDGRQRTPIRRLELTQWGTFWCWVLIKFPMGQLDIMKNPRGSLFLTAHLPQQEKPCPRLQVPTFPKHTDLSSFTISWETLLQVIPSRSLIPQSHLFPWPNWIQMNGW